MNAPIKFIAGTVFSVIARCRSDHDSCVYQPAHGQAERIVSVRIHGGSAETHVDDPDVVSSAIGQHPVECLEQAADGPGSLRVEHAEVDDISVRCDSGVLSV